MSYFLEGLRRVPGRRGWSSEVVAEDVDRTYYRLHFADGACLGVKPENGSYLDGLPIDWSQAQGRFDL